LGAVGCGTLLSGLIGMFLFDILQIPIWCNHIRSGGIAATVTLCLCARFVVFTEFFYED
jgi:uncharacterized membrane protein